MICSEYAIFGSLLLFVKKLFLNLGNIYINHSDIAELVLPMEHYDAARVQFPLFTRLPLDRRGLNFDQMEPLKRWVTMCSTSGRDRALWLSLATTGHIRCWATLKRELSTLIIFRLTCGVCWRSTKGDHVITVPGSQYVVAVEDKTYNVALLITA